jgi:N-ethylmaleimide reductase
MHDSNALATFSYMIGELSTRQVGYLCLLEPNAKDLETGKVQIEHVAKTFRPLFSGPLMINTGFDKAKGQAVLASGDADLVAFGTMFIANPDLPDRFRRDASLNKLDPTTFYGVGPKGYTDYPSLAA